MSAILPPYDSGVGLGAEWVERMLAPQIEVDDSLGWALSWGIERSAAGSFFWQWGDDGEFKAFAIGSREKEEPVVILTNSANGLNLCRVVVEHDVPGPHPALSFHMLDYS